MKIVQLEANEFLSFYTGYLLGDSYDIVISAVNKLYGCDTTLSAVVFQDRFIDFVNTKMPDICDALQNIGPFRKEAGRDIMEQVNEYVDKFKREIGSDTVDIDIDKMTNYSKEEDFCR